MRRFEVEGQMHMKLSAKYFVREGKFSGLELVYLDQIRRAINAAFPQTKKTKVITPYRLFVEETDIGFFQARIKTETRQYVFNQPTLAELAVNVEKHLSARHVEIRY